MGNSAQRLMYRANVATIAPGQVVSIPAATHGLTVGNGTALIPNYVECAPLKATINATTGEVLVQNTTAQTLANVRVIVGYEHSYIGANDNPLGNATYAALVAANPTTAALSAGVTGDIVATIEEENPAVALANNAVVPFSALPATIAGASNAAGTLTLPAGTYVANWAISILSAGAGIVETRLTLDPAGAATIAASTSTTIGGAATEATLTGGGVFTLAATGTVAVVVGLAAATGSYATAGAAENEVIGTLHLRKIA